MIEFMTGSQANVLGIEASGTLTDEDYKTILIPRLEALFRDHDRLRILFHMRPDFDGWELRAAWDDAAFGFSHRADFERIAVVGGPDWVNTCIGRFGFLIKGDIKSFGEDALADAWSWLTG